MNNCRAGLYGFTSTTTWLHKTGMASPPFLVMLGLTLPDSRILSGIAGIGLTLANIAIILPHLRQPILDSMHAHESVLAHEQGAQEKIDLSPVGSDITQLVDLNAESPVLASVSFCDREYPSPHLSCSATIKSVSSAVIQSLECLDVDSKVGSHTILSLQAREIDDGQTPPQIHLSPDADSSERLLGFDHLCAREGRGALHVPLPVPDVAEVAFFDTTDANCGLGEERPMAACVPEERPVMEVRGPISKKGIEQGGQPVTANLPSTSRSVEMSEDLVNVTVPVTDENAVPIPTKLQDHHNSVMEGYISHPSARGGTIQSAKLSGGKEAVRLAKRRPESLNFIPQSVIRHYPSSPMVLAGHSFGHPAFSSGHDHQVTPVPPYLLVDNPTMPLEGTRPRANYTTLEGHWRASFLTEVHPKRSSMGGQTFVIETAPAQDPPKQGPVSLPKPSVVHKSTSLRKCPTHRRRLGVLARAALRDRRSTARRCRDDPIDGSSTSDGDSELDSDSQHSSGSSAYESMLPHMLGADLIAAIDANSESELNLVRSRTIMRTPLDVYKDFLVSEGSVADLSMIMHVSSNDDASDSGVRAPATFRSLTYEDIQQWASGVVQKCVRQVCRSRAPVEPLSPSQASDVCAERPTGSGISQCPLSGLHCKPGAAVLAEVPAPRTREPPVSLQPTFVSPGQKPLSARNLRDIPEFVPRQRRALVITGRVEDSRTLSTRHPIDITHDAATEVIAKMESQAGFNTRRRLMGTDENQTVGTTGGWQGTLRCA